MNENKVKEKIQELVDDFKSRYSYYKSLSEPDIETKLIYELFVNILGWDRNDFRQQEKVRRGEKRGRADYGFYIKDKLVFFLEVKKIGVPLDKEADKQVISYALSKRVQFAISTNFEQMKIFCVEQENATTQIFRVFNKPEYYISNFQNLILLSKESFEKNLILKEAENEGRLKKRMSMDKILLDDLMHIRKLIADDIEKTYSQKYDVNDKEEIVQRIIDRLIFIRRCEDVGINPENLYLEEVKHLPDNKAYPKLKEIFEKYNDIYNSGLFAIGVDNDCDVIKINGLIIKNLISYLYESKDKQYIYNFDWIDADVLGQVYEQYLGKILEQTKSGRAKLKDGQAHRKESGIYYTPTYIVDYIVRSTLLEALKNKKVKSQDIKILDCACGSGSFLIKAFDYLYENLSSKEEMKQQKIDSQGAYSIKTEILKRNIFGVDLDNKAVEITKLNLLLKASEKGRKLPEEVDLHIKHGNSLINDEGINKNAFDWKGDFQEGSFDVVIGNPPYIRNTELSESDKIFFNNKYLSANGQYDIFVLFFELGIKLLKNQGYLGFITSNKFIASDYGNKLRDFILKNCKIKCLIDVSNLKVFKDASTYPVIIILQKDNLDTNRENNIIVFQKIEDVNDIYSKNNIIKIKQSKFSKGNDNRFIQNLENKKELIAKIEQDSSKIGSIFKCQRGSPKNKIKIIDIKSKQSLNCIFSKDVNNYYSKTSNKFFVVSELQNNILSKEKILIPRTVLSLKATYDEGNHFIMDRIYYLIPNEKNKLNIKFVVGLLNSKLMDFYYKVNFGTTHIGGGYLDLRGTQIQQLPIKNVSESQQRGVIQMVDKMLDYNKELIKLGDKTTSETKDLNDKINSLDEEINEKIYELYGITKAEQGVIEKS